MNTKRDFLREVDVQFARLFGELNPIPPRRTPSNVRQDAIGSDAYLSPIVGPCCHPAEESTPWTDDASTNRGRMGQ
jgi:hypothetical protein